MLIEHLGKEIRHVAKKIKHEIDYRTMTLGITGYQSRIIRYILDKSQDQEVFQKDIEEEFKIKRSSVTSVLQTMEKNGLIQRISVKQDARLKKIILTDKALQLSNQCNEIIYQFENDLQKNLTPEELASFMNVLQKLNQNLDG